jgi:2-polyprenyl-3-methyl-5-hydroxy-6-metoxy-1,4-benzoquinol methylase
MLETPEQHVCVVCSAEGLAVQDCEVTQVRSNVRRFRDQQFAVWRCPRCRSLHARDAVSLDFYYRDYPRFGPEQDAAAVPAYRGQLRRLERAGVTREHHILDYGCGQGGFVRFLQARGFRHVVGYDAYVEAYNDASALRRRYDCVFSQDVLEHVEDPLSLLSQFSGWCKPSGLIVIGTPEASAIDLARAEDFVHPLHMPYHRHIWSAQALRSAAQRLGWELAQYYPTMYGNVLEPGQSTRFCLHYLRSHDDCIDVLTEPLNLRSWKLYTPVSAFWFFFGYFFDRRTDVTFVFRAPASLPAADAEPARQAVSITRPPLPTRVASEHR